MNENEDEFEFDLSDLLDDEKENKLDKQEINPEYSPLVYLIAVFWLISTIVGILFSVLNWDYLVKYGNIKFFYFLILFVFVIILFLTIKIRIVYLLFTGMYTIMIALKAMYPIPNYPSYIGNLISFGFLAYLVYEYFDIYHKKQFSKYREIVKKTIVAIFIIIAIPYIAFNTILHTPKIGETIKIMDLDISVENVYADKSLEICFGNSYNRCIQKEIRADSEWKFIIIEVWLQNLAKDNRTFFIEGIEDNSGLTYKPYQIPYQISEYGVPWVDFDEYADTVSLLPKHTKFITIAFELPANADPAKLHFSVMGEGNIGHGVVELRK